MAVRRAAAGESKTRALLLDAAEHLMLSEGYPAVTSRKVGREAGISPQLVHYYFASMDEVFLSVLRRRGDEGLARYRAEVIATRSLRGFWEFTSEGAVFDTEFAALANHRPAVRKELTRYSKKFRAMQLEAITGILAERGLSREDYPPFAILLATVAISSLLLQDRAIGLSDGHAEMLAFVDQLITGIESEPRSP